MMVQQYDSASQGQAFTGAVIRDDTGMVPVNGQTTLLRDPDGAWRVAGHRVEPRVRVVPLAANEWTTRPWWTIVLAIVLFPIGLLALLYTVKHRVPQSVLELTAPSGQVTAIRLASDAGHLAVSTGASM